MGVSAHARIGIGAQGAVDLAGHNGPGEVLDVDLVDDARARRDNLEVIEGALTPTKELVAFAVALELEVHIELECIDAACDVDHDGVVDHHFRGGERIDFRGISAKLTHGFAHCCQVDDARHAGEVLHDDARRRELDFFARLSVRVPAGEGLDVRRSDVFAVLGAQEVFEQHFQTVGKPTVAFDGIEGINLVFARIDGQGCLGTE